MSEKEKLIDNLEQIIRNARVELEQGGKYDWNPDLASCDELLEIALSEVKELKKLL